MLKIKYQTFLYLLVFTALFHVACEKKVPIPEEKFIEVYVDLLIVQDTTRTDSLSLDSLKSFVFEKHGISGEEYNKNIYYYNSEPKRWEEFFNMAISYVEERKKESEK